MMTIATLAQKGGVGKTTLTLHWAVEALRLGQGPVAVVDMDTQQSAVRWASRRAAEAPRVLQANADNVARAIDAVREHGFELVLLDTMPRVSASSVEAAKLADFVVIPCGPSPLDIEAISETVGIVRETNTPAAVVLNRGRHSSGINAEAIGLLERSYGLPVCPHPVMHRAALADAFVDGRAVAELEPGGKAADEISATWSWIHDLCRSETEKARATR